MTAHDHDAADQLDRYLDRLARGDAPSPAGLDPRLAAAARALRAQDEAVAPDPRFVARLRETLLMDATIPAYDTSRSAGNGVAPFPATSPPPRLLPLADARHRDARRRLAGSAGRPIPPPVAIGSRRAGSLARRWNRHGWPIVELIGAAVLIVGLVSVMVGGNGGGGLPALLPGFGQTSQDTTPVPGVDDAALAFAVGDAGRSGAMPGPGPDGDPELRWRVPIEIEQGESPFWVYRGQPVVMAADGLVLYVERTSTHDSPNDPLLGDTTLHVAAAATGLDRWTTTFGGISQGNPLIAEGLVIVTVDPIDGVLRLPSADATPPSDQLADPTRGYVLAFDLATGAERWRTAVGRVGYQDPVYSEGMIYLVDRYGDGHGLDVVTGAPRWRSTNVPPLLAPRPADPTFTSVSVGDGLVLFSNFAGTTYAFGQNTGDLAWIWPDLDTIGANGGSTSLTQPPVIAGQTVYVSRTGSAGRAILSAVDLTSGQERWEYVATGFLPLSMAVSDGVVVMAEGPYDAQTIHAIDAETGRDTLWQYPIGLQVDVAPTIADGTVYVGGADGTVTALSLVTGEEQWGVRTGGAIASPAYVAGGVAYFASLDDNVYAIAGTGETAAGTGTPAALDVSGLPPCAVEPRPEVRTTPLPGNGTPLLDVPLPDATPALTLPDTVPNAYPYRPPMMTLADIPSGQPLTDAQASGVSATLRQMLSCARSGDERYLAAFYTDHFFLRPWVVRQLAYDGSPVWSPSAGESDQSTVAADAQVLVDGRIAYFDDTPSGGVRGALIVLREQDGGWLVDEWIEVTSAGYPGQG